MLLIHEGFTTDPVYFLDSVLFYCLGKLCLNLRILKFSYLLLDFWAHPIVFWIMPIYHIVLSLLSFPGTTKHVTTHAAFEIAKITKSIIPAHWLHSGVTSGICCCYCFCILMPKHLIKVTTVNISIEQSVIAYFTLWETFPT